MNPGPHVRRFRPQLPVLVIAGALLGCSPEGPSGAPEPAGRRIAPALVRATAPQARPRPTLPVALEPEVDERAPAPAVDAPPAEPAQPVTVEADAVPDIGRAPLRVQFEARVDAGGDGYTCDWEFGDGYTAVGNAVEHEFTAPGSFMAQVRVTTNTGATGSYEVGVEVDAPAGATDDDGP